MMGSWLARLKNKKTGDTHATKPTKPSQGDEQVGFVGFVAYPLAPFGKIKGCEVASKPQAENLRQHEIQPSTVGKVSARAPTGTANPEAPSETPDTLATVYSTDLYTWPHSPAMNAREVDTFTARLTRFTDKGVKLLDAERLIDALVIRDREGDDRTLCLECAHLQGWRSWCCSNWKRADVIRGGLPRDLVLQLHRCGGFALDCTRSL